MSVCNVENADSSTRLLAATTLRNVLGTRNMSEILTDRDSIAHTMQVRALKLNILLLPEATSKPSALDDHLLLHAWTRVNL